MSGFKPGSLSSIADDNQLQPSTSQKHIADEFLAQEREVEIQLVSIVH